MTKNSSSVLLEIPYSHNAPSNPLRGAYFPPPAGVRPSTDWSNNPFAPGATALSSQGPRGNIAGSPGSAYDFERRRNGTPHVPDIPHPTSASNNNDKDTKWHNSTYVPRDGLSDLNLTYQPAGLCQQASNGIEASARTVPANPASGHGSATSAYQFDGPNGIPHIPVIEPQPSRSHVGTYQIRTQSPTYDYNHSNGGGDDTADVFSDESLAALQDKLPAVHPGRADVAHGPKGWCYVRSPSESPYEQGDDRSTELGEIGDPAPARYHVRVESERPSAISGDNPSAPLTTKSDEESGSVTDNAIEPQGDLSYVAVLESRLSMVTEDIMNLERKYGAMHSEKEHWYLKYLDSESQNSRKDYRINDLEDKLARYEALVGEQIDMIAKNKESLKDDSDLIRELQQRCDRMSRDTDRMGDRIVDLERERDDLQSRYIFSSGDRSALAAENGGLRAALERYDAGAYRAGKDRATGIMVEDGLHRKIKRLETQLRDLSEGHSGNQRSDFGRSGMCMGSEGNEDEVVFSGRGSRVRK